MNDLSHRLENYAEPTGFHKFFDIRVKLHKYES